MREGKSVRGGRVFLPAVTAGLLLACAAARAEPIADFYAGKQISF